MTTWADEYVTILEDREKRSEKLTDWECGFVDSLQRQIADGRRPSAKQVDALDNLWERATADGLDLESFHRRITRQLLTFGRYGILTDVFVVKRGHQHGSLRRHDEWHRVVDRPTGRATAVPSDRNRSNVPVRSGRFDARYRQTGCRSFPKPP